MRRRILATAALTVFVLAMFVEPAGAAHDGALADDRRISLSGGVVVRAEEVVDGPVVSIDGPATINGKVDGVVVVGNGRLVVRGRVTGDILVVHGDAVIIGHAGGDVVATDGRVTVRAGATVHGDVVSRWRPDVAHGTVRGEVKRVNLGSIFTAFLIAFLAYLWIAVTVSVALFGVLFVWLLPRAADASVAAARPFWSTFGSGLLVGIAAPLLGILVLATIVGIPFGIGVLSALTVLAPLGYVVSSLVLGRLMVKGTTNGARMGAFFAGFGIMRLLALIPGVGLVVGLLVSCYGLGAVVRAGWRAGGAPPLPAPPPPDTDTDADGAEVSPPAVEPAAG
jgi:hypothetical protein